MLRTYLCLPVLQVDGSAEGMPPFNHSSAANSASTPTLDIAVDGSTLSVPISASSPNLMKSASSPVILSTDHHRDKKGKDRSSHSGPWVLTQYSGSSPSTVGPHSVQWVLTQYSGSSLSIVGPHSV